MFNRNKANGNTIKLCLWNMTQYVKTMEKDRMENHISQAWWYTLFISALGKLKQEDLEFKTT